jgi:hypothetical protein
MSFFVFLNRLRSSLLRLSYGSSLKFILRLLSIDGRLSMICFISCDMNELINGISDLRKSLSMFWVHVSLDFNFVFVAEAYDLFVLTLLVVILLKFTSDVIFWF